MNPARAALRAIVVGLAVALPVSADAPTSGPDRQYQEFTSGTRVIVDRFTGLRWERPVVYGKATFAQAAAACRGEEPIPRARLPSLKELLTLVDEEPHPEYDEATQTVRQHAIDRRAFPKTPADEFWTSSVEPEEGRIFTVHFGTGGTHTARPDQDERWFRCVNATPDLPPDP